MTITRYIGAAFADPTSYDRSKRYLVIIRKTSEFGSVVSGRRVVRRKRIKPTLTSRPDRKKCKRSNGTFTTLQGGGITNHRALTAGEEIGRGQLIFYCGPGRSAACRRFGRVSRAVLYGRPDITTPRHNCVLRLFPARAPITLGKSNKLLSARPEPVQIYVQDKRKTDTELVYYQRGTR